MTIKSVLKFLKNKKIIVYCLIVVLIVILALTLQPQSKRLQPSNYNFSNIETNYDKNVKKTNKELKVDEEVRELSAPPELGVNWKSYKNKNIFEIQYPTNWSTDPKDQGSQQGKVFNASIDMDCGKQYCPTASVAINYISSVSDPILYLQNEVAGDGNWELSDIYWVKVGTNKYLHYLGCQMGCYDVFIYPQYDNDSVYSISFYNSFDGNDQIRYKNIFDQILYSINFY